MRRGALRWRAWGALVVPLAFTPVACSRRGKAGASTAGGAPDGAVARDDAAPTASAASDAASAAERSEGSRTLEESGPKRERGSPSPLTPAEVLHAKAYLEALKRGRKATVAKTYADAVAAFTEALSEKPGDTQALAERGYAELLDDQLAAAEKDLKEARASARARLLTSQIEYNLGLVAKKRGKVDFAEALFAHAKAIRAGADAGPPPQQPCDVGVDYGPLDTESSFGKGDPLTLEGCASWKACFDRVAAVAAADGDSLTVVDAGAIGEDLARATLLGPQGESQGAWLIDTGPGVHLLAKRPAPAQGFVLVPRLERHSYYRCGDWLTSVTVRVEGGLVRVDAVHTQYLYRLLCLYEDAGEVTPGECDPNQPDVPMQSYCPSAGGYAEFTSTFFDPAAQVARVRLRQIDEDAPFDALEPEVTFQATRAGIVPSGGGCKDTIPLSGAGLTDP
jgi:hypothetical protein